MSWETLLIALIGLINVGTSALKQFVNSRKATGVDETRASIREADKAEHDAQSAALAEIKAALTQTIGEKDAEIAALQAQILKLEKKNDQLTGLLSAGKSKKV